MSAGTMEEHYANYSIYDDDCRALQPLPVDGVFASFKQPEQAEKSHRTWKGWSIGNYILVNHSPPLHGWGSGWKPFLIVDIVEIRQVGVRFVLAYIFSEETAMKYAAAKFRKETSMSGTAVGSGKLHIGIWPSRADTEHSSYALSNYFELFCDVGEAYVWPQAYRSLIADGWIFDITTASVKRAQIPATSSIGHALGYFPEFHHFLKLPRELRDAVYEFAFSDCSGANEIDVATLIDRWQKRGILTSCHNRFNPLKRAHHVQTPALLWASRQLASEAWDTLCHIMTLVLDDDMFVFAREQYRVLTRLPRLRVSKQLEAVDGMLPDPSDKFGDVQRALREWDHVRQLQMCIKLHDVTDRSILGKGCWSPWDAQRLALDSSEACSKLASYLSKALGAQIISWRKIETGCERWMSQNLGQHQACGECWQMYAESACICGSIGDIVQASPYAACSMCVARR